MPEWHWAYMQQQSSKCRVMVHWHADYKMDRSLGELQFVSAWEIYSLFLSVYLSTISAQKLHLLWFSELVYTIHAIFGKLKWPSNILQLSMPHHILRKKKRGHRQQNIKNKNSTLRNWTLNAHLHLTLMCICETFFLLFELRRHSHSDHTFWSIFFHVNSFF